MRFADFLKSTVTLSAGAATALATVTILAASSQLGASSQTRLVVIALGWWIVAGLIGAYLGRRAETSPPIARLLAGARASTALPEHHPGAILVNRLWPLLAFTVVAGGLALLAPQVPAIATGFALIWALAWRRQHAAVTAIEERDGVSFYVRRTSPLRPIALDRLPGFKAMRPEPTNGAIT